MAQSENTKISRRTQEGIHASLEKGKCTFKAPIGYKNRCVDSTNKYVEIDKEKAPLVREIFDEVAKGIYTPCCIQKLYARKGQYIPKNTFLRMLRNRFYIGEIYEEIIKYIYYILYIYNFRKSTRTTSRNNW